MDYPYEEGDRVMSLDHDVEGTVRDPGDGRVIGVEWDDWNGELGYENPADVRPAVS